MTFASNQTDPLPRLASLGQPGAVAPRLLVLLAHPDDEVLALGGRLEHLGGSRFLCITDGVPQDGADMRAHGFSTPAAYHAARRAELFAALALAGLPASCAGELRLAEGATVSDQQAAHHLPRLARAIADEIRSFQPDAILTHPYEGGHPDHDACAFAVWAGHRLAGGGVPILEAPFYHAGPSGMETGCFLGEPGVARPLSPEQQENKRLRLACFASQGETLAQFSVTQERYRLAPPREFTRRPHPGRLFYENFRWGMDGDSFCKLADIALRTLGLEPG